MGTLPVKVDKDVLYRYEEVHYSAGLDEFDNPLPFRGTTEVILRTYEVTKRTPKGAWIRKWSWGDEVRFVLLTARKKFACETTEDAGKSFVARKTRQLSILHRQVRDVEAALLAYRMKSR